MYVGASAVAQQVKIYTCHKHFFLLKCFLMVLIEENRKVVSQKQWENLSENNCFLTDIS